MLELKQITKTYTTAGETVHALKGIDLTFRDNEFVSILGPSGCGKTTMLNIIGGLDQYTSGDLIINGVSTKNYKERDWDTYRNHSIGFVFQSYNLIPHQTVLQNVEIALTLSGVKKAERRRRAIEALEKVGLGNQLKKRPAQMSGGQMQRVAIARAIVNDPEIVLADEPTGALDTETSVQVMDILKEIAKDRLVVMVTHNPDLAEKYSTRIIKILDGLITDDSKPVTEAERKGIEASEAVCEDKKNGEAEDNINKTVAKSGTASAQKSKYSKKSAMSFGTAFGLSMRNLFTKKGRTILVGFAGSIGIIGIALIYAVSEGTTRYIDDVQEETLSSYPITLESETIDTSTLLQTFTGKAESTSEHENDAVYQKAMMYQMMNAYNSLESQENDLASFKDYIEEKIKIDPKEDETGLADAVAGVQYTYDLDLSVYTKNVDGNVIKSDTEDIMEDLLSDFWGVDISSMSQVASSFSMSSLLSSSSTAMWQELLPGNDGEPINDMLYDQYEVIYGSWPSEYNEVVLFVDSNNELNDLTLYALGLKSKDDIDAIVDAAKNGTELEYDNESWSYEEICNMEFRTILDSDCYVYNEETGSYDDLRDTDTGLRYLYDNGIPIKVVGIVRPKEGAISSMVSGSIGYTSKLVDYVIEAGKESDVLSAQINDPDTDVISGLPFAKDDLTDAEKADYFKDYADGLSTEDKQSLYLSIMSIPSDEMLAENVEATMSSMTKDQMKAMMIQGVTAQMGMDEATVTSYIDSMSDDEFNEMFTQLIEEQVKQQYAQEVATQMAMMTADQLADALDAAIDGYSDEECAKYYDEVLEFSDSTYEDNLTRLGYVDLDKPSSISLYATSFENKDVITDAIESYNETVDELSEIHYTDYIGIMMSSITTIINAITYVLIAFVAVSLIVSSIMIGVITLISVQERTKEIGILRAIGASKKNVSNMFNAETVIIGFLSGALGVAITYLLCIPINAILNHLTGIANLKAQLPITVAGALVLISVLLTLIAGIIPSRSAAKKDPVVALRTE